MVWGERGREASPYPDYVSKLEEEMAEISVFKVAPGKNDLPFSPYVHIWLSQYSGDSAGNIFLSPQLMTDVEIDESVDRLIQQLEKARRKAKRELKQAKEGLRDRMAE